MASIVEAFDCTMKEAFTGIKVLLWAIPLSMIISSKNLFGAILIPIFAVFFTGFLMLSAHNVIVKNSHLIPGINFLKMGLVGISSILVIAPFALIGWILYLGLMMINIPNELWSQTYKIIVILFSISISFTACAIYMRRLNAFELLDVKKYILGFWDIFIEMSYFFIKFAVWGLILVGFMAYIFSLFVGFENVFWTYILCAITIFGSILCSNYLAQVSEEIYLFKEEEEKKKKDEEQIAKFSSRIQD